MKLYLSKRRLHNRVTPPELWLHQHGLHRDKALRYRNQGETANARLSARAAREFFAYYILYQNAKRIR